MTTWWSGGGKESKAGVKARKEQERRAREEQCVKELRSLLSSEEGRLCGKQLADGELGACAYMRAAVTATQLQPKVIQPVGRRLGAARATNILPYDPVALLAVIAAVSLSVSAVDVRSSCLVLTVSTFAMIRRGTRPSHPLALCVLHHAALFSGIVPSASSSTHGHLQQQSLLTHTRLCLSTSPLALQCNP